MTLAQLRAFLAAYELGSFTAAARRLETTQTAISELIARLEREIGMRLFVRGGRRLMPTAAADELRGHAQASVSAIESGIESLHAMSALQGGVCTFGVLRNAAYYDLSDLAQQFHQQHPKVKIRLVGLNSALVAESIAAGEIEAGLIVLPVPEVQLLVKPLFRDEVLYASAVRDPAAGPITLEEMADNRITLYDAYAGWKDPTRRQLLERSRVKGLAIDPVIEVEHVETALNLVAAGAADTMVSRTIAEGPNFPSGIRTVSFAEPFYDTIALVQRKSVQLSPATRRFAELAEQTLLQQVANRSTPEERLGDQPIDTGST
ncbi:LysR family transcriptional regulator [Microlunatus soli]|uniref:DNA-binding transcriptional regulator, LysR family n=1 Tax=Microlunatus soli TaxID=630515 RepID=A0A1H2AJC8_9ACTN|nr:LysR family transcriptional regulator [Microlunatus soli]SDT45979.1 DNA-binding transcriptional regulator, LysR family [Microlunatus soli]